MKCPQCQMDNKEDPKFCLECWAIKHVNIMRHLFMRVVP